MTEAQREKIVKLGGDPETFHPQFDLPDGYVAGWANGVYYGIDEEGQASLTDKELKEAVTNAILSQIGSHPITVELENRMGRVVNVEIHNISTRERQVRVKTYDKGTHYYSIKIAEIM